MEEIQVPKKVEQINDYSFIDTYNSKVKICVNELAKCVWDEKTKLGQY